MAESNFYAGAGGSGIQVELQPPVEHPRRWQDGRDFLFSNEYPMIRFLEQNGYDISYVSGLDTHLDARSDHQAQGVLVRWARRVLV